MTPLRALDPFDLPDWLGVSEVTWTATGLVLTGHLVGGVLRADGEELPCDLLGVDEAYPQPVADEATRVRAHQAWRNGEVLLVEHAGRTTLAVPGTCFDADRVLDAVGRLARAVGARPERFAVSLRLGRSTR